MVPIINDTVDRMSENDENDSMYEMAYDKETIEIEGDSGETETAYDSQGFTSQKHIEEERLRSDILKYLVKNSNGTYHYSSDLRAIIHNVVGIPLSVPDEEFQETAASLLDILHSDPQRRFLISGERDNILVKRCFVRGDEDEISDFVEEWRALIAAFLLDSKRSVGLSDVGSSIPRPMRIPASVKLIFIMKTDPLNRFILKGDGNAVKVRYNMATDPNQESLWNAKWRDDLAIYLTKQQFSVPSSSMQDLAANVPRPFCLSPNVKLRDVLEADPFQRFVVVGFENDAQVIIRNFRGDEPEIEEFVENWRLHIASYLMSKSAMLGVPYPLLGLSEIGANVPRAFGVPASVKLIDVMRADTRNRFIIKGDGNALRAKINSGGQAGRVSLSSMSMMSIQDELGQDFTQQESGDDSSDYGYGHSNIKGQRGSFDSLGELIDRNKGQQGGAYLSQKEYNLSDSFSRQDNNQSYGPSSRSPSMGMPIRRVSLDNVNNGMLDQRVEGLQEQRLRQSHQVQQFHQRQVQGMNDRMESNRMETNRIDANRMDSINRNGRSRPQSNWQQDNNNEDNHSNGDGSPLSGTKRRSYPSIQNNFENSVPISEIKRHSYPSIQNPSKEVENISMGWNGLNMNGDSDRERRSQDRSQERSLDHDNHVAMSLEFLNQRGPTCSNSDRERNVERERVKNEGKNNASYFGPDRDQGVPVEGNGMHGLIGLKNPIGISAPSQGRYVKRDGNVPTVVSSGDKSPSICSLLSTTSEYFSMRNDRDMSTSQLNNNSHSEYDSVSGSDNEIEGETSVSLSSTISLGKKMIKGWLHQAFKGFDYELIESFVSRLRDDGGFVTVQDLVDAQKANELTREALSDIVGFKLGHFNRFNKALAMVDRSGNDKDSI